MCTLLTQCASQTRNCLRLAAGTLEAVPTQPRAHGQSRGTMHLLRTAPVPLSWTLRQTWWSRVTNVGPVRRRAIDSSELRLTTDREGRQVGQHRSHIVAAVSSACLIARAAASGSRRVGSCQASRPAGRVQTSACLLSGVICRRSVRPIRSEFSDGWRVYLYVLLEISPNLPSD